MKAAQIQKYGGLDAVQINDIAKPVIEADEVLVQVKAVSVNPFDYKLRDGAYEQYIPLQLPATIGGDLAGVIVEIGQDVSGCKVGDEVYGMANSVGGNGSFAEYAPVKAERLSAKPKQADFVTSAALPLAAVSAYQALADHINLEAGQKILIHGGSGGIGSLAIQIAKDLGAYVATTVSAGEADYVKELGADEVIDYKTQDFSEIIKDYDAVFDNVGGEVNAKSYAVLKPGGKFVSMVDAPNEELAKQYSVEYVQQNSVPTKDRLSHVAEFVDAGKLNVNVDKIFEFEQIGEALEYLKIGHPRGKVVAKLDK